MNFYSPKAYNYVRSVFKNKLPAPSTIRNWYSNTNGSPGCTQEALQILKRKQKTYHGTLYACLTMDEMALRKQIEWDPKQKKFIGYIDYGLEFGLESEKLPVAKEVLVYLLTCVNQRWKIPVAYYFVNGLTSEERAEITNKVLSFLTNSGVKVIALTFDGLPSNINMCTHLNASNVNNNNYYFVHPSENYNIPIFFDAPHMLKLIRNTLASKDILYDGNNNAIRWEYFVKLNNIQQNDCFHLANKLTSKHIQWFKNKMNVKLAAQTLSESCAIAMEQLYEDGHPDFADCIATAKFCRIINNIFDCLNCRNVYGKKFKKPLTLDTAKEIFLFFEESIQYLSAIKLEPTERSILKSRSKTGFIGFIIDMTNLKMLFHNYVEKGYLKYILAYKLSQDHLEIFFSCIRRMGGYNNNPNAKQFIASYKRLLHHNEVKSSTESNCIPLDETSILNVSSNIQPSSLDAEVENEVENNLTSEDFLIDEYLMEDLLIDHSKMSQNEYLPDNHAIIFIAGYVEKKLLSSLKCIECCELLNDCEELTSQFIKRKSWGFLRYPRADTYSIIKIATKVFNFFRFNDQLTALNAFHKMVSSTLRNINMSTLFINFDIHTHEIMEILGVMENHKYILIKSILYLFFKIKLFHYGKHFTLKIHNTFIRHDLTKTILFKGQ